MIQSMRRRFFEAWGSEAAQNSFLKGLVALLLVCLAALALSLAAISLKGPKLIAVSASTTQVLISTPPPADWLVAEVKRVAEGYVAAHYNWDWQSVDKAFQAASKFVAPAFAKKFLAATEGEAKIVKEKHLSQKFYVANLTVDAGAGRVTVAGDRILVVEGLRATSPITLDLSYEAGERTDTNPEGIYITAEKLVSPSGDASKGGR